MPDFRTIFARFSPVFFLVVVFGLPSAAFASICGKAATCERFNLADAIFIGRAVSIETGQNGSFKTETTIFEIKEVFSGDKLPSIGVRNKSGFSGDTEFEIGTTYLIFASGSRSEGFGTGFCSGNLPVEYAAAEIAELRKLSSSKGDGKLRGTVLEEFIKRWSNDDRAPLRDIRLDISEIYTARKYTVRSDEKGRYEIAVPPGKYKVDPVVPKGAIMSDTFESEPMEIRSGGCAENFFVFKNNSNVEGFLLDVEGKPVRYARVSLVPLEDDKIGYLSETSDESDANGGFSIGPIPAGKYTLSINYDANPKPDSPFPTTFYPFGNDRSKAQVLEIGVGSSIKGLVWNLPPRLIETEIAGKVVWEDGSPALGYKTIRYGTSRILRRLLSFGGQRSGRAN